MTRGEVLSEVDLETELIAEDSGALIGIEANLEIPPIFRLGTKDTDRRSAECWTVVVKPGGERLEQYWRISVPEPHSLPGTFDQDVWVAVQALVNRRGGMPQDGKVYFTLYELLGIMQKSHSGRNYDDLKKSLLRLQATNFYSDKAFYLKDVQDYETIAFNPWSVAFKKIVRGRGEAKEKHELEFHSLVRRSFQAEHLKVLDSEFYYSLRSPLAKRLYRLIDRKRQGRNLWRANLMQIKELAPLAPSYKTPGKIREILEPAHRELVNRGFLRTVTYDKRGKTQIVRYQISPDFIAQRTLVDGGPSQSVAELGDYEKHLAELLCSRGVWANVAQDLVRRYGPEKCATYVEALKHQEGIEKPGAWLRYAIEMDHPLPNSLKDQPSLLEPEYEDDQHARERAYRYCKTKNDEVDPRPAGGGQSSSFKEGYEWFFGE